MDKHETEHAIYCVAKELARDKRKLSKINLARPDVQRQIQRRIARSERTKAALERLLATSQCKHTAATYVSGSAVICTACGEVVRGAQEHDRPHSGVTDSELTRR